MSPEERKTTWEILPDPKPGWETFKRLFQRFNGDVNMLMSVWKKKKAKEDRIRDMIREEIESVLSESQEDVLKRKTAVARATKEMQQENDPIQKAQKNVNLKHAEVSLADAQSAYASDLASSKREELSQAKEQESNIRKAQIQKEKGNVDMGMMSV